MAWHNVTFANVEEISAKLTKGFIRSKDGSTATMAAALPRTLVPLLPPLTSGLLTGADFSCNILGQQKKWWLNDDLKASEIVWDEPTEAELYPASWGKFNLSFA